MKRKENSEDIGQLLIDYLLGELPEDEMKNVRQLIDSENEVKELYIQYRDTILASGIAYNEKYQLSEEELAIAANKITSAKKQFSVPAKKLLKIAAIFVLLIGIGVIINNSNKKEAFTEYNIPLGSKASIVLKDSTIVWLNAGSKLKLANNFGKKNREVFLEGEGFFDVTTDKNKPFIVNTNLIKVKALGTMFNVKAYADEKMVETVLVEGIVKIEDNNKNIKELKQGITLKPNQNFYIQTNKSNSQIINNTDKLKCNLKLIAVENTNLYTSWKDDVWEFKSESLENLASKLGRRYNVDILFVDERLKQYKFTGKLKDESLEQVLKAIELSANVKISVNGRIVKIDDLI